MGRVFYTESENDITFNNNDENIKIDKYKIIGLHIDLAINKLRGIFPTSNNYFSRPSLTRYYDKSCLFQFGTPMELLHVFVENDIIIDVLVIF